MDTYTIILDDLELDTLSGYLGQILDTDPDMVIAGIYNKLQAHIDPYGVMEWSNDV
jgi:hypothetical protein